MTPNPSSRCGFSVAAALLLVLTLFLTEAAAADRPPNIVIIFADDLGYGDLGCYGAEQFATPHLDRMAAEGLRFTDFYVAASVCSASRAGLLTGRYPTRTGVTGVISANTKNALPLAEVTLAERLGDLGYATGICGKWHLGNTPDVWPLQQGFDEWFGTIGSNDMGKGKPSLEARRAGKAGVELVDQDRVVEVDPDQRHLTRRYTERAVDFINRNADRPFFLYVPHNMPHTPLFASERFDGQSERGLYGDVIAELDDSVGAILAALAEHEVDEHTVVLFTSDNGPWLIFGDHGGSAGPLSGGKKQSLDGGQRVPLIVRWPGTLPAGEIRNFPTISLDLFPTLLRFADADATLPQAIDGIDVGDLLQNKEATDLPERPLFFFYERELRAIRLGRWKLQLAHLDKQAPDPDGIGFGGARGAITTIERPRGLFDLAADPGETTDLTKQHPEVVERLSAFIGQGRRIAAGETE